MRRPNAPRPEVPPDPEEVPVDDQAPVEEPARSPRRGRAGSGELGPVAVPGGRPGRGLAAFSRRRDRLDVPDKARGRARATATVVSSGLTDRLAERRRAGHALVRRRLVLLLGLLAGAALVVWVAVFSPLLALRPENISVTGSDGTVTQEEVRQVLGPHAGQALIRLDLASMGREVSATMVRVRSAHVTRSWPHGVTVNLTMRVPVVVRQTEGGFEVLDSEAVALETVQEPPAGLVTVVAPEGTELSQDQVRAVAGAVGALDESTRSQVEHGSASDSNQVTLVLGSGATVVWGDSSEQELKAQVLRTLLGHEASVYDVSSPRSPTTS